MFLKRWIRCFKRIICRKGVLILKGILRQRRIWFFKRIVIRKRILILKGILCQRGIWIFKRIWIKTSSTIQKRKHILIFFGWLRSKSGSICILRNGKWIILRYFRCLVETWEDIIDCCIGFWTLRYSRKAFSYIIFLIFW